MSNAKAANNSPPNANNSIIIADNTSPPIQETIFLNLIARMVTNTTPIIDNVAVAIACPCARTSITINVDNAQMSRPCNRKINILNFFKSNIAIIANTTPKKINNRGTLGEARLAPNATPRKITMKNGFSLSCLLYNRMIEPKYTATSNIIKAALIMLLLYSAAIILLKMMIGMRDNQNRTIPIIFSSGSSSLTGRERRTYKIQRIKAGINPNHLLRITAITGRNI